MYIKSLRWVSFENHIAQRTLPNRLDDVEREGPWPRLCDSLEQVTAYCGWLWTQCEMHALLITHLTYTYLLDNLHLAKTMFVSTWIIASWAHVFSVST